MPLLAEATRLWLSIPSGVVESGSEDACRVDVMAARIHAFRETRELREEERQLGTAVARVLERLGLAEADYLRAHPRASYVLAYALAVARWSLPEEAALSAFAFSWLENQLAAATRLMRLGQLDAQQLLMELAALIPRLVHAAQTAEADSVGCSLPGFAAASALHERQYSRLFRS